MAKLIGQRYEGRGISDELLAQVYLPIGLDIGADAPAEIAISVLAEVLIVLRKRRGKHLRMDNYS